MSNPSFSNIDLWLFELAEGNLSPEQIERLEMFILQNPDLDFDRDVWEMAKANTTSEEFGDVSSYKRKAPVGWYFGTTAATLSVIFLLVWFLGGTNVTQTNVSYRTKAMNNVNEHMFAALQHERTNTEKVLDSENLMTEEKETTDSSNQIEESVIQNDELVASVNWFAENEAVQANRVQSTELNRNEEEVQYEAVGGIKQLREHPTQGEFDEFQDKDALNEAHVQWGIGIIDNLETNEVEKLSVYPISRELVETKFDIAEQDKDVNKEYLSDGGGFSNSNKYEQFEASNYHESFSTKLNRLGRRLRRMMDNPIALKNYKDPHYHVPGMLPNDINMSSTGTLLAPRVQTLSRVQWLGEENEQLMNQLAVDGYAYGLRGGVGIQLNHSMYADGGMNIGNVAITYSPKFSITSAITFEPSVRFKMGNKSLTRSKLEGVDQVELNRGNVYDFYPGEQEIIGRNQWYKDLGVGAMVNTEWFFVGMQVDNIFRHKDNIYSNNYVNPRRAYNHFIATAGTDWTSRKENLSLSPYVVYQKNEDLSEMWAGMNLRWNWMTIGAAVSNQLDPGASLGMKFKHFAFTYNVDYVKSSLTNKSALSHQVTLRFLGNPGRMGKRILNL